MDNDSRSGQAFVSWRDDTFTKIPDALARRRDLSLGAKILVARIHRYGSMAVTQQQLADALGTSTDSIARWTTEAENAGLIVASRRLGKKLRNRYVVADPMPQSAVSQDVMPQTAASQTRNLRHQNSANCGITTPQPAVSTDRDILRNNVETPSETSRAHRRAPGDGVSAFEDNDVTRLLRQHGVRGSVLRELANVDLERAKAWCSESCGPGIQSQAGFIVQALRSGDWPHGYGPPVQMTAAEEAELDHALDFFR